MFGLAVSEEVFTSLEVFCLLKIRCVNAALNHGGYIGLLPKKQNGEELRIPAYE